MITARVEVDLHNPLKRGEWWNSNQGEPVWIRYHWVKQPHSLCDQCYRVIHDDATCEEVVEKLRERAMTEEEYEEYCKEKRKDAENDKDMDENGTLEKSHVTESSENDEAPNAKRARKHTIQDNGSNPSLNRPILAEHGVGGGTEKTTKLSTVETMDVIRMDEYEVHIAGAEKNPLQSLENHALLVDAGAANPHAMQE